MEGNKPEVSFRAGGISASVWNNPGKSKTGEEVVFNTISLQRTYKDKAGEWKHTSSMRINDLPKAALVLRKAYEHIVLKGSANSGASIPEEVVM